MTSHMNKNSVIYHPNAIEYPKMIHMAVTAIRIPLLISGEPKVYLHQQSRTFMCSKYTFCLLNKTLLNFQNKKCAV